MTIGNLVSIAEALVRAKQYLLHQSSETDRLRLSFMLRDSIDADEEARLIGIIEGCWGAFVTHLLVQLGAKHTPEGLLAMDERAREIAAEAYRSAYRRAIEGVADLGA